VADAALISGFGFLNIGQQQVDPLARFNTSRGFRPCPGISKILSIKRCLLNGEKRLDIVRTHGL
jgi:hypothetical protein